MTLNECPSEPAPSLKWGHPNCVRCIPPPSSAQESFARGGESANSRIYTRDACVGRIAGLSAYRAPPPSKILHRPRALRTGARDPSVLDTPKPRSLVSAMQDPQSTRQNRGRRKRRGAMHEKFKANGQVIDSRDRRRLRQHLLSKGAAGSSQPDTAAQHGAAAEENGSAAAPGWGLYELLHETVRAPGSTQNPL